MMLPPGTRGRALLAADLARHAFASPASRRERRSIGAELELLPIDAGSQRMAPLEEGPRALLPMVRAFGAARCWTEGSTDKGTPCFHVPGGGRVTFEPGGQLEYSAPPASSVTTLREDIARTLGPLRTRTAQQGVELVALGIDPTHDAAAVPMQLRAERYERMDAYLATIGPFGARMMRQTAALQISIDAGAGPTALARWRVLNAAAPYIVAMFANSPRHAGALTANQSMRAECWRRLDPARTGIVDGAHPVDGYLAFALAAPDMLRRRSDGTYAPFGEWLDAGTATSDAWHHHLSTLFPEVRPRGYLEVRGADTVDPAACAAPLALIAGLAYADGARADALALLGPADAALLERAGRAGLRDAGIATAAAQLADIALAGCRSLGEHVVGGVDLEIARDFVDRYTRRGRSPADDTRDAIR